MLGALKPMPRRPSGVRRAGVTVVELMVTLAIVAVLAAIAVPSMAALIARKRLEGLAQELMTDLRFLKSYQIHNRPATGTGIGFSSDSNRLCYMLFVHGDTADCDCGKPADLVCGSSTAPGRPVALRQVDIPRSTGIRITTDTNMLTLGDYNGMPIFQRTLRVSLANDAAGEIVVSTNGNGIAMMCSVSGAFGAIKSCSQ